jgi:hypothetical protein
MKLEAKGRILLEEERRVDPVKLAELAVALGTDTAQDTARLVLFFAPAMIGQDDLAAALDLDFSRALLVGHRWHWERPFTPAETVAVRLQVEDVYFKGDNGFAIVVAEFRDAAGELIQAQWTTFIERGTA